MGCCRYRSLTSQRLQHTIAFAEEATPTRKAKPAGVMGAENPEACAEALLFMPLMLWNVGSVGVGGRWELSADRFDPHRGQTTPCAGQHKTRSPKTSMIPSTDRRGSPEIRQSAQNQAKPQYERKARIAIVK